MLTPRHDILRAGTPAYSPRRVAIVGTVAMLHVAIVYALVTGMAGQIAKVLPPEIVTRFLPTKEHPPEHPIPPQPHFVKPDVTPRIFVPVPTFKTASDDPPVVATRTTPSETTQREPIPDTAASGLAGTHTVPPYPALARLLGQQGTVVLQLSVSAQGMVTSAAVVQSSGFPDLDAAAIAWVEGHWRYRPATEGGVAVPSQTRAAVKFDLTRARG